MLAFLLSSSLGRAAMFAGASAIAVGIAFGAGFTKGDLYRAKRDNVAALNAQIEFLNRQARVASEANTQDQQTAAEARARADEAEKRANDAVAKSSDGTCLDGDDVGRLRGLWPAKPGSAGNRKGH